MIILLKKKLKPFFTLLVSTALAMHLSAQVVDYSNINNWAAHTAKWDFADSLPSSLKNEKSSKKVANVFFIHPTTYTELNAYNESWYASVQDITLNDKTDKGSILFQASCFNQHANVFAPRYRQAHLQSFYNNSSKAKAALDTAYVDVKNAFQYFINNLNNNLPIIIAAHSQGTVHAGRLLKEFFENKPLQSKLVAAYLIGMPVSKKYFSTLQPCTTPNTTGCFVSWRSYLQNSIGEKYIQLEEPNSVYVTNPISFTLDTVAVNRKQNDGAVLLNFNKVLKGVSGAQVHNNILWVTKPKFTFSFLVKNNRINYHIADINLFYMNIRKNIAERLNAFGVIQN
jgi:hypothetical protein